MGIDLEALKKECKEEMFVYSDVCLKLIEIIEEQEKELYSWREEFMGI
jgi:hypothetical protein